jgi:chitin disaccharide deacetylase
LPPKLLIVNADDFGLHQSINDGIAKAHIEGIVTSTSLMAGTELAPAFEHALSLLPDLPNLDIGLHFTLLGAPGLPPNYKTFMAAKLAGHFPASRVSSLLRRQLDCLLSQTITVSHIDSHQHIHALPSIMRTVAAVAKEYGIRAVRLPRETAPFAGASAGRIAASKMLALLTQISKRELDPAGIKYTDHFSGMAISGKLTPIAMLALLNSLRPGTTEILCHPGTDNAQLGADFDWGYAWEGELAAITSGEVLQALSKLDIVLGSFKDL